MLRLGPHGRGPRHLIYVHLISAMPLEKHMDSNHALNKHCFPCMWRTILPVRVMANKRNIRRGSEGGRGGGGDFTTPSHFIACSLNIPQDSVIVSPARRPRMARGSLKEGENVPRVKFHSWWFYMQLIQKQSPTRKGPITFSEKKKKKTKLWH